MQKKIYLDTFVINGCFDAVYLEIIDEVDSNYNK